MHIIIPTYAYNFILGKRFNQLLFNADLMFASHPGYDNKYLFLCICKQYLLESCWERVL